MNDQVARTILAQLGGQRFKTMTGAYSFSSGPNALGFRISSRNKGRFAGVRIELTPADVYDVHFIRLKKVAGVLTHDNVVHEGIYADQLVEIFERETGLVTSL